MLVSISTPGLFNTKLEGPTVHTVLLCDDNEFHELHELDVDYDDDIDLDNIDLENDFNVLAEFDEEDLLPL